MTWAGGTAASWTTRSSRRRTSTGSPRAAYGDDAGRYLSDRLTDEVLSFIEENRTRPFFVYLADHAVHAPFDPKPALREKYQGKAAAGGHVELCDLEADPGEQRNLAEGMPDKAATLTRTLRDWQRQTAAAIPQGANPAYDPAAKRPQGGPGGAGGKGGQGGGQGGGNRGPKNT
jgi:hypothetical protein